MKWRSFKYRKLRIGWFELHDIHTCNSRDPKLPATNIVGAYIAVYWDGVCKWQQIVKLDRR